MDVSDEFGDKASFGVIFFLLGVFALKFLLEASTQLAADHLVAGHEERVGCLIFFSLDTTFIIDVVNAAL